MKFKKSIILIFFILTIFGCSLSAFAYDYPSSLPDCSHVPKHTNLTYWVVIKDNSTNNYILYRTSQPFTYTNTLKNGNVLSYEENYGCNSPDYVWGTTSTYSTRSSNQAIGFTNITVCDSNYVIYNADGTVRYAGTPSKSISSAIISCESTYIVNQSALATVIVTYSDGSKDFCINNGGSLDHTFTTTDSTIVSITQSTSTLNFNKSGTATISTLVNNIPIYKTISVVDAGIIPITEGELFDDSNTNVLGDKPVLPDNATFEDKVTYYTGLLIYYICLPFNFLIYLFNQLFIVIQSLLASTGTLLVLMGKFFSWLPSPLPTLITTAIIMTIILKVLKR